MPLQPPPTEIVAECCLCGGHQFTPLFPMRDFRHQLPGEFCLVRCECGLIFLSPRPKLEQIGFYYPSDRYYSYTSPAASILTLRSRGATAGFRDAIRRAVLQEWGYPVGPLSLFERAVKPVATRFFSSSALYGMAHRFPRYREGGRALDIGCGSGAYLSYLKHHGWDVAGVEISTDAARMAKKTFDIDVFAGNVGDAPFAPASFDFIHMHHVIEHLPNPVTALRAVARLLKSDGILFVATPNCASYSADVCGRMWFPWDSPRHLALFTAATLETAFNKAGFRVQRMWTTLEPGIMEWEDTYIREEQGEPVDPRPQIRELRRRRASKIDRERKARLAVDPISGENLICTAQKAS